MASKQRDNEFHDGRDARHYLRRLVGLPVPDVPGVALFEYDPSKSWAEAFTEIPVERHSEALDSFGNKIKELRAVCANIALAESSHVSNVNDV